MPTTMTPAKATNLQQLRDSGWQTRSVKTEIHDNFLNLLAAGEELFPGIIGFEDTVIPEINIALLAEHDMLFLGEKGQAKSRLMRNLARFLDDEIPFIDIPDAPFHDDPYRPISRTCRQFVADHPAEEVPIGWWPRDERYAERLAPGTKFADIIGEIDPAKLAGGVSMSAEEALHFGLIPRMHRGIFAINELPELDELVQVGLFNILEERDVQIRGYPIRFDIDVLILFSANPATYNRSGKVIPQLKDRIGSVIHTHYPRQRDLGIQIMEQEADIPLGGDYPVVVPYFMREIIEQITVQARKSKYIDHQSGVSARFSIANYRAMVASARQRAVVLGEKPAVPRISDLGHIYSSSLGKLGTRPDGQPSDDRAPGAGCRHGRSDPHDIRGIRGQARSGRDCGDFFQGREDRRWRHVAGRKRTRSCCSECRRSGTRRSKSTRQASRPFGLRAWSSCWRDCTRWTKFPAHNTTASSPTKSNRKGSAWQRHLRSKRRVLRL